MPEISDPQDGSSLDRSLTAAVVVITSAYLSNNTAPVDQIPAVIAAVRNGLMAISAPPAPAPVEKPVPAVPIRKSIQPDHLVCLEDGKKLKMLKRHLMTVYNMTPAEYRAKWGLPDDYPMVAPDYAAQRSALAKEAGLGTRSRGGAQAAA